MPNLLKAMARGVLKRFHLYGVYSLKIKGPLFEDGWLRSFEEQQSVDREGSPIPFITYPAIAFLTGRIRPEMRVFEYGSGASTLWWANRVQEVKAAEHNRSWYERISEKAPPNAQILWQSIEDKESYPKLALEAGKPFSIIVIDGRLRVRCARYATQALGPDGVIVWDNSDRDYYKPGFEYLHQQGFRRIEFVGLIPIRNEKSETSIFYRPGNCLGI